MRRALSTAFLIAVLGSCGGSEPTAPPRATTIALSATSLTFTSLLESQDLTATVRDQNGAPMSGVSVTYESTDSAVATVSGTGRVTAVANGLTGIRVSAGSLVSGVSVTVQQMAVAVTATAARTTLTFIGDTTRASASATDAQGQPLSGTGPVWSSSDPGIVQVGPSGLVTAVGAGTATLSASFQSATGTVALTVAQVPAAISLSPDPVLLSSAGATATAFADVRDAAGAPITQPAVTWSSSDPSIAQVDDVGRITAVADGSATITGAAEGAAGPITDSLRVTVNGPPEITTVSVKPGVVDAFYSFTLKAGGGGGSTYTWALSQGTLPVGLTLGSGGTIVGTPTAVGSSTFEVTVTGQNGLTDTRQLTLAVWEPIGIVPPDWPSGAVGKPYAESLEATGGDGAYTWTVLSGAPPAGLELAPGGVLSGSPTAPGVTFFTVQVASGDGQSASRQLVVVIYEALRVTTTTMPTAWTGVAYGHVVQAVGGSGGYAWSMIGGALPDGLTFASNGLVSGTPLAPDTTSFTVQVESPDGQVATGDVSIAVSVPLELVRSYLPGGYLNTPYSAQIEPAVGGTGEYTYTVTDGALPVGLTLDPSTGTITGTPVSPGMAFFAIGVESGSQLTGALYSITISNNPASGFNLWGVHVSQWLPSARVRAQINAAFARWEAVILDDLRTVTIPGQFAGACNDEDDLTSFLTDAFVDDVLLLVDLRPIDGAGPGANTLGYAFPCLIDSGPPYTIMGRLALDLDNYDVMSDAQMFETTWHEVGHVMGIGSLWEYAGLINGSGTTDPRFTGTEANQAYSALAGTSGLLPIEADGEPGTAYVHWDEGWLDGEIMTGWAENGVGRDEPISRITLGSLADLGWSVDDAQAEAFSLPPCAPDCSAASVSGPAAAPSAGGGVEIAPPGPPVETTLRRR